VTQNPLDVPEDVAGQLGNRVQHGLRAFTPRDQKAVRAAAETFRPNPGLDAASVIGELGVGEALVSLLDAKGAPEPVERAFIAPPLSRLGALSAEERAAAVMASPLKGVYDQAVDRESAYERLAATHGAPAADRAPDPAEATGTWRRPGGGAPGGPWTAPDGARAPSTPRQSPQPPPQAKEERGALESVLFGTGRRQGLAEAMAKSVVRSVGSRLGRELIRGLLGSLKR